MARFTDEERAKIIAEYRSAVATKRGGGAAVRKRYGLSEQTIYNWARAVKLATSGEPRRPPGRPPTNGVRPNRFISQPVTMSEPEPKAPPPPPFMSQLDTMRAQLEEGIKNREAQLIALKVLEDELAVMRRALDALNGRIEMPEHVGPVSQAAA